MLVSQNIFRRKLGSLALKVFHALENNGNARFDTNGEERFMLSLFGYLQGRPSSESITLFDIGGNVGEYTQLLVEQSRKANVSPTIHVFEPTSSCFAKLQSRFQGNSNIVLNQRAASDQENILPIYYDNEASSFASLYQRNLAPIGIELDKSESIQAIRLDGYIEELGIGHVQFMKIDIEGHELSALRGLGRYLSADFIDFVQFEYGGANLDSHSSLLDLYTIFGDAGFTIAKIMPKGLAVTPYRPAMDNFNYANYVAISQRVLPGLR